MIDTSKYSPEAVTALEMIETIAKEDRKYVLEKLRDIIADVDEEEKWDKLLREHPGPMREMAREALKEHRAGKTSPMEI